MLRQMPPCCRAVADGYASQHTYATIDACCARHTMHDVTMPRRRQPLRCYVISIPFRHFLIMPSPCRHVIAKDAMPVLPLIFIDTPPPPRGAVRRRCWRCLIILRRCCAIAACFDATLPLITLLMPRRDINEREREYGHRWQRDIRHARARGARHALRAAVATLREDAADARHYADMICRCRLRADADAIAAAILWRE